MKTPYTATLAHTMLMKIQRSKLCLTDYQKQLIQIMWLGLIILPDLAAFAYFKFAVYQLYLQFTTSRRRSGWLIGAWLQFYLFDLLLFWISPF